MTTDPQQKLDLEPSAQERLTKRIVQAVQQAQLVRRATVTGVGIAVVQYDGVHFKVQVTEITPP